LHPAVRPFFTAPALRASPTILLSIALAASAASACSSSGDASGSASTSPSAAASTASAPASASTSAAAAPAAAPSGVRQGSAIALSPEGNALYVADEDHGVVRRIGLPLGPTSAPAELKMPGAPAQVLALGERVLVTVRNPGLLLVLKVDPGGTLSEEARVQLPADAWGMGLSPDGTRVFVTSAWTHQVSLVDLGAKKVLWQADVPREPRGVVAMDNDTAYVSHLVGADLTRVSGKQGSPAAEAISLLPSPVRAPSGKKLGASLGYALAVSDDGDRLFAARHALGALARRSWFGQPTVDVLLLPKAGKRTEAAQLAATHQGGLPKLTSAVADLTMTADTPVSIPGRDQGPFVQPRAMVFRSKTKTLLVAGEGDDTVAELDARALDPTLAIVRIFKVGKGYEPSCGAASECGAPSGIALADGEASAYVYCRSTDDVVMLDLSPPEPAEVVVHDRKGFIHLADDTLPAEAAKGRRLFYNATDPIVSGGLGCAGCHPEGRDDGHVWHEAQFDTIDGINTNFVGAYEDIPDLAKKKGYPRRTPMLAGMVKAQGPYGWHGESESLPARLLAGFGLHRWGGVPKETGGAPLGRAQMLTEFVRTGLVPPPREERELTDKEKRGKEIFTSEEARCSKCHVPDTDFTDRVAYPFKKLAQIGGFDEEAKQEFKTPSLRFVGGRAPYFHDGRASTLEKLVELNGDRMGRTTQLSADDRAALIAYLRTL
jgi:DNA-binding beta-propeller fold protein YncE/mono/diheme cytochrome c family protein